MGTFGAELLLAVLPWNVRRIAENPKRRRKTTIAVDIPGPPFPSSQPVYREAETVVKGAATF
jgi:hypothetical protein